MQPKLKYAIGMISADYPKSNSPAPMAVHIRSFFSALENADIRDFPGGQIWFQLTGNQIDAHQSFPCIEITLQDFIELRKYIDNCITVLNNQELKNNENK